MIKPSVQLIACPISSITGKLDFVLLFYFETNHKKERRKERKKAVIHFDLIYLGFISDVCKTYGSGIFYTFNKTAFHLKTTCPVTLTRFSHAGVDCHILVQRGPNGLMDRVEIIVNKITTLVHNNTVTVEGSRISLPYDHTYQHVFHYGIYTRLQSKVLPLSVTWYSVADGVSSLWVSYH
uniref:VWFD domain-containing protein n=1 Tax=Cyprinus carpio TaxID=7962 RepID=A0A8C1N4B8_CYPCA